MEKKQIIISLIMTMFIAAFMALGPKYIHETRTELTLQHSRAAEAGYKGIISVWHIAGFKPYQGSLGSWVGTVAEQLEDEYSGIYFEVDSITPQEYENRIARGEQPDVYSFPLGFLYADQLLELNTDIPVLLGNLDGAGDRDGRVYGIPYAASGYFMVMNQRLLQEHGLDAEDAEESLREGELSAAGNPVQAFLWGARGSMLCIDDFIEERAAAAFVGAREAGDLARKVQNGKGFPYSAVPCGSYTDHIQLIGANRNILPDKIPFVYEFIRLCMERENQERLIKIGIMPVNAEIQNRKSDSDEIEKMFLLLENITAPNTFLYKTYRDQLEISAAEAMCGSESAKKDLDLRITELVRGAAIK